MISAGEFVKLHQESENAAEVAKKAGVGLTAVYQRAKRYRESGIALKKFKRHGRPPIDIESLKKLAKQYA